MQAALEKLGRLTLVFLEGLGRIGLLFREVMGSVLRGRIRWDQTVRQMEFVGIRSLPVVLLTGAFSGMVMAVQMYFQLKKVGMETGTGPVVSVSMTREIGPVFAALMVAGRVGAAIAAELGTMKVTEQVDALRSFAVHPVDFLVVPRFVALVVTLPILTGAAMFIGIECGRVVAAGLMGIDLANFDANMIKFTDAEDVIGGLIKAGCFAVFISMISCYKGLNCSEGAEGVGRATTEAVVVSSITVLISNFFITYLLSYLIPP